MAKEHWTDITDFKRVNKKLGKLREWIMEFSDIFDVKVVDFYEELNKKINEDNKNEMYIDGLHFTPKGNEVMLSVINTRFKEIFSK